MLVPLTSTVDAAPPGIRRKSDRNNVVHLIRRLASGGIAKGAMALRFGRTVNTVYMASAREVVNWLYGGQSAFSQQSSISELGMRRAHNSGSVCDTQKPSQDPQEVESRCRSCGKGTCMP